MGRQEQMIERLVAWLHERGLAAPAVLLLEVSKPLLPIGSQFLLLAQPLIEPLGSALGWRHADGALAECAELLEDPLAVEEVLVRLESRSVE